MQDGTPRDSQAPPSSRRSALSRPGEGLYGRLARAVALLGVTVVAVMLARNQFHRPFGAPVSAAVAEFSAARAMRHVEAIAVAPRPQGSQAAAAGRDYIVRQLESLGLTPEVQTVTGVRTHAGTDVIFAATVVNVMARIPGTDSTGAIVLSGHYDSGPNARGAGDCGGCVATVLETGRALLAGPPLKNDVILLFPDGEETQLYGSRAFVEEHPWARGVAFALNLESQGSSGPAVFYVSSPNDARVAAKVIEYADQPAAWSFLSTLVRGLVGGSDLDSFTDAGIAGAGVAHFESEQYYHTALDSPERLDRGSLQHLGGYALGVVRGLGNDDLDRLAASSDSIYFTLWRGSVVRYPESLAVPLALIATVAYGGALYVGRRRRLLSLRKVAAVAGLSAGTVLVALTSTSALWQLVRITNADYQVFLIGVSYQADSLVLGVVALTVALLLTVQLWAARRFNRLELAAGSIGVWWFAAALTSFALPSFSPLFTWPLFVALAVFAFALWRPSLAALPWLNAAGFAVVLLPTMLMMVPAALLFWTLGGRVEVLLGLPMMGLPVFWSALGAGLVLPFLALPPLRRSWGVPATLASLALLVIGWTSATSGFDAEHPKPNMVMYDFDADSGRAAWLTTAVPGVRFGRSGQIDSWTSQFFGDGAEATLVAGWSAGPDQLTPGYRAAAPLASLQPPLIEVLSDGISGDARTVRFRLSSPRGATNVRMYLEAPVIAASIDGIAANVAELDLRDGLWVHYLALPARGTEVTLTVQPAGPFTIQVHDWSQGIPSMAGFDVQPRPAHTMPSAHDLADTTMVRKTYELR